MACAIHQELAESRYLAIPLKHQPNRSPVEPALELAPLVALEDVPSTGRVFKPAIPLGLRSSSLFHYPVAVGHSREVIHVLRGREESAPLLACNYSCVRFEELYVIADRRAIINQERLEVLTTHK